MFSFETAQNGFSSVLFSLCKSIDTPHSLATWLCFKYDHEALLDLQFPPEAYGDDHLGRNFYAMSSERFKYDLLVSEFVSKYKGLSLKRDVKAEAVAQFKRSETRMIEVNQHLKRIRLRASSARLEAIISIARRKISRVLGTVDQINWSGGWGPGSTFTISRDVGWDKKILEKRISITAEALPYMRVIAGMDIAWCRARGIESDSLCSWLDSEFQIVNGNRITTVPKNAKTDRTIAIEPTGNIFLQKAVGSYIRSRLLKVGIDLNDQKRNQRAAAFLSNATIDMKAASDSISCEIVRLLLPDEWVDLLDALRSKNYTFDRKTWHRYAKWSSMGNGYTFELETLIFWALAFATQSADSLNCFALVYGDDVIVPVTAAESVIETFKAFGFEVNLKKTHYKSLYRESCGSHFFDGQLVTPIYQKETLKHVEELYHLANRLRRVASRLGGYSYSDKRLYPAWRAAVRLLSDRDLGRYSPFTGDSSLDGCLNLSLEDLYELQLPVYLYGSKIRRLVFVPQKRESDHAAGLALTLLMKPSNSGAISSDSTKFVEILSDIGIDKISMRGRGKWYERHVRVYQSFSSNCWL